MLKNSIRSTIFVLLVILIIGACVKLKNMYDAKEYVTTSPITKIAQAIKKYMPLQVQGTIQTMTLSNTNASEDVDEVQVRYGDVHESTTSVARGALFTNMSGEPVVYNRTEAVFTNMSEVPVVYNRTEALFTNTSDALAIYNGHRTEACGGSFTFPLDEKKPHPFKRPPSIPRTAIGEHFYRYTLQYIDAHCDSTVRAGNMHDGGWDVCISGPFQMISGECKVLSFGISYDFSFDDFMAKTFNCTVHSFDPSMTNLLDTRRSKNSWFHRIGLGGSDGVDGNWKIQTLKTILANLNWTNEVIDVLKFDIEKNEIKALPTMLADDSLSNVKQLSFELHSANKKGNPADQIPLLTDLLEKLNQFGFRKFMFHENLECVNTEAKKWEKWKRSRCIELYYINERFVDDTCRLL